MGARNIKTPEGIIERNMQLLFERELCTAKGTARGIAWHQQAGVLVMNLSEEYRHLNKDTTIAFLDKLADIQNIVNVSD